MSTAVAFECIPGSANVQIENEGTAFEARVQAWAAWLADHREEIDAWLPSTDVEPSKSGRRWFAINADGAVAGTGPTIAAAALDANREAFRWFADPEVAAEAFDAPEPADGLERYLAGPLEFLEVRGPTGAIERAARKLSRIC